MANEVKTTFVGDAAQLFKIADQVEQRLKALQSRTVSASPIPPASAASTFSQPAMVSRSIQSVSVHATAIKDFEIVTARATETTKRFTAAEIQQEIQMKRGAIAIRQLAQTIKNQEESLAARDVFARKRVGASRTGQLSPQTIARRAANESSESLVRQFAPPEADLALNIAQAVGVSGGALLIAGGVALAGAAVVKWSKTVREEAERRLKLEESISAAFNKQILQQKQLTKEFEQRLGMESENRSFQSQVERESNSPEALEKRRKNTQALLDIERKHRVERGKAIGEEKAKDDPFIKQIEAKIAQYEGQISQLAAVTERARQNQSGFTVEDIAKSKAASEAAIEAERKAMAERLENFEKGKQKVEEIAATWKSAFQDLASQSAADNPIARVFLESQTALDKLKENLKGLPKEMQAAALASQQAFNANQLFGARADSALSALDLRDLAARFRDDTEQRRNFSQGNLNTDINRFNQRLAAGANVNVEANLEFFNRRQSLIDRMTGDTPEQKLDRQLEELRKLNPANTAQQSILDQRVLRLGGSVDPNQLRGDQRERIAQSAERQAEREENRFQEAIQVQREQLDTQKAIAGFQKTLLEINARGGIQAVENTLTIKDETNGSVDVVRTPTAADTARVYDFQGFGIAGGTNR